MPKVVIRGLDAKCAHASRTFLSAEICVDRQKVVVRLNLDPLVVHEQTQAIHVLLVSAVNHRTAITSCEVALGRVKKLINDRLVVATWHL